MSVTISNANRPSMANRCPFYAQPRLIAHQRITGIAMIAIGVISSAFGGVVGGGVLIALGGILIGASLIQQAVGNAPGCTHGKVKRIAAGVLVMLGGPIGWIIGGVLWHLSNRDNQRTSIRR